MEQRQLTHQAGCLKMLCAWDGWMVVGIMAACRRAQELLFFVQWHPAEPGAGRKTNRLSIIAPVHCQCMQSCLKVHSVQVPQQQPSTLAQGLPWQPALAPQLRSGICGWAPWRRSAPTARLCPHGTPTAPGIQWHGLQSQFMPQRHTPPTHPCGRARLAPRAPIDAAPREVYSDARAPRAGRRGRISARRLSRRLRRSLPRRHTNRW